MGRLIEHRFAKGQRWKNANFTLYILAVNDDLPDEGGGEVKPGKICVTEEKPFPGKRIIATDLHPNNMEEVIQKGGYELMDVGWESEHDAQAAAILAATPEQTPIKRVPQSGLGAMMQK